MTKIALLGDTHFGIKSGYGPIHENMWRFFENVFFPYLSNNNITTIAHMGDVFHDRTNIRFPVLHEVKNRFLNVLRDRNISMHVSIGNHDTTYRTTSDINSPDLILGEYENISVYKNPVDIQLHGHSFAVLPWINRNNTKESHDFLKNTKSQILFGHLQIVGFLMNAGIKCKDGVSPNVFDRFDRVFSGHFHKQSIDKNIHYIGSPFQFDFADVDEKKGFHVLDLKKGTTEFVENPYKNYHKILFDDVNYELDFSQDDFSIYRDSFVKIVVIEKNSDKMLESLVEELYNVNANVRIEDTRHTDETVISANAVNLVSQDTLSIITSIVSEIDDKSIENDKLQQLMSEIYTEALNS
jgi:DNA repair exonuclease SbcCD nuclease subunit